VEEMSITYDMQVNIGSALMRMVAFAAIATLYIAITDIVTQAGLV